MENTPNFYLLNTPIITNEGGFLYQKLSQEQFIKFYKHISKTFQWVSFIGHPTTALNLSSLLDDHVPSNRGECKMQKGDFALVFRFSKRLEEGQILEGEEYNDFVKKYGEFGILYMMPNGVGDSFKEHLDKLNVEDQEWN